MELCPTETSPFIDKLYDMIMTGPRELVRWNEDGCSFVVVNPQEFQAHVLSRHFRSANFASFVRQLNFYGFRKMMVPTPEGNTVEFQHEQFQRDRQDLISQIRRRTSSDYQAAARQEVAELVAENSTMKSEIARLQRELDHAYAMYATLESRQAEKAAVNAKHAAKRRRSESYIAPDMNCDTCSCHESRSMASSGSSTQSYASCESSSSSSSSSSSVVSISPLPLDADTFFTSLEVYDVAPHLLGACGDNLTSPIGADFNAVNVAYPASADVATNRGF